MAPFYESLNIIFLALAYHFDPAVQQVLHPSLEPETLCLFFGIRSKTYTLDSS
jgi:hypothetical protein